jgi:colanic acid/amylovoran biosynthesis glycosyltransferase
VVNPYPAPSHAFIRREIAALERLGWCVHRFTRRRFRGNLVEPADREEQAGTSILRPRVTISGGRFGRAVGRGWLRGIVTNGLAKDLRRRLAPLHVRHLHAHFHTATDVCLLACRDGQRTFSFTVHGLEEFEQPDALRVRVAAAAFVACVSEYTRARVATICPQHTDKLHVVRCGIAPTDDFISTSTPDVAELVCFTGWADEASVRQHLAACRGLVLPSMAEGLPVVLMEALACGRSVIATDVGGVRELVDEHVGLRIPPGNVDALVEAMRTFLAARPDRLDEMAAAGRTRVLQRHGCDDNARVLANQFRTASAIAMNLRPPGVAST